jgi:amino acid permease
MELQAIGRNKKMEALAEPLINADDDIYDPEHGACPLVAEGFCADSSGTGTFVATVLKLLYAAIGAGILALPSAFQNAWFGLGIFLCCLFGTLIVYSLHILGRAQKRTNSKTYQAAVEKLLGARPRLAIVLLQLISLCLSSVGYLDVMTDQLSFVFNIND